MSTTEEGGLQLPAQLEQGAQADIKMEEARSTSPQLTKESRRAPQVLPAGVSGEFLPRSLGEEVKREQNQRQLQRWEVQWQEFLKTMEASQSSWRNPRLRDGCVSSGVPPPLQGQPVTVCHPTGEHVPQGLPDPCELPRLVYSRPEYGDFGQVKEEAGGQEALGTEGRRRRFRQFLYREADGPCSVCRQLHELCHRWLQPKRRTQEQMLDLVVLEQFLAILPQEMLGWVQQRGPETCSQAAALAEEFLRGKQAAEGPEEQGLEPREEAALNFSKATQAPLGVWRVPVERQVEEGDVGGESFLGQRLESMNEEEKCDLERSEHRAAGTGICSRRGIRRSAPSLGPKPIFKTVVQHRIHPWQKLPLADRRNFRQPPDTLVKREHAQAGRKPYLCLDCGKTFFMFLALRTHQRTHERSQARAAGHGHEGRDINLRIN
ncbi:zinc finger protein 396-like isoform X2 [Paroedura picta]|uniref:zinc finger protein 396-like isoform X2 n=1 Tax=Paroedura picta TaxID=143630 RepID=UPI00405722C3